MVIIVLGIMMFVMGYLVLSADLVQPDKVQNNKPVNVTESHPVSDKPASILSETANYPSPVQQLQQTVAYGLVNQDAPNLPLLKGELDQFSQKNIQASDVVLDTEKAQALNALKQRLDALNHVLTSNPSEQ
ncbi:hypothetical protein [Photobacterium sp. R1]